VDPDPIAILEAAAVGVALVITTLFSGRKASSQ
jgi:hypothetical protein